MWFYNKLWWCTIFYNHDFSSPNCGLIIQYSVTMIRFSLVFFFLSCNITAKLLHARTITAVLNFTYFLKYSLVESFLCTNELNTYYYSNMLTSNHISLASTKNNLYTWLELSKTYDYVFIELVYQYNIIHNIIRKNDFKNTWEYNTFFMSDNP